MRVRFRYRTGGVWLKGNTHLHSTASDGGMSFAELAGLYAGGGYDFLFRTDHWVASDVAADKATYPLLWLDGIELDGSDPTGSGYHVVCLGKVTGMERSMGLVAGMESARKQGALLILAHPHWMGNSLEDALRWNFDGVEVYNHVCQWLNGKGGGAVHWEAMLKRSPAVPGLAVDDAHVRPEHPGWNGGWIVVNAARRSGPAILEAIRAGRFYSSCGPTLAAIEYRRPKITVKTSPVRFIRLVGPNWLGCRLGSYDGKLLTEGTMDVPQDWPYVCLEVEDDHGRRAWTNTLLSKTK